MSEQVALVARGEDLSAAKVIGQVFDGYIVCQHGEALVLIDQHALHERILFERLTKQPGSKDSQRLLAPARVVVGAEGVDALERLAQRLEEGGWELEPFGEEEVLVRAIPAALAGQDPAALAEALLSEAGSSGVGEEKMLVRALAAAACRAAVRVGQRLERNAAAALLSQAAGVEFSACCPHGRPVARRLTRSQVERLFGR